MRYHKVLRILLLMFAVLKCSGTWAQSAETLYSIPLKTIDEVSIDLSQMTGKKILLVVLPSSSQDTTLSKTELQSLLQANSNLVVLGIPAGEFGYSSTLKNALKELYASMPPGFTLTEGMNVQRSSGANQSPLFQWLTDRNKNRHFDQDVTSTGQKFFIDEAGELFAVFNAKIKLSHPAIGRSIARTRPD
jgi:glutathione peroxidase